MSTTARGTTIKLRRGEITVDDSDQFTRQFLEGYLSHGLGGASKRDIDLLLVHLLINSNTQLATVPLHKTSLLLQIPESRLAGLIYEAKLRYPVDAEVELKSAILARLAAVKFKVDKDDDIKFVIEDKLIRQAFAAQLKQVGTFLDSSFNREVVKVAPEDLIEVLNRLLTAQDKKEIENKVHAALKADSKAKNKISFDLILKEFVKGAASKSGELGVSTVATALTGGHSLIVEVADSISAFFGKFSSVKELVDIAKRGAK